MIYPANLTLTVTTTAGNKLVVTKLKNKDIINDLGFSTTNCIVAGTYSSGFGFFIFNKTTQAIVTEFAGTSSLSNPIVVTNATGASAIGIADGGASTPSLSMNGTAKGTISKDYSNTWIKATVKFVGEGTLKGTNAFFEGTFTVSGKSL